MDENFESDNSEYYQTVLANLALPDHYKKLIQRIKNLKISEEGFNVETVGDILKFEPYQFSNFKGVGNHYVETLIEFKKELPYLLKTLKQEPNSVYVEEIFTSSYSSYDFETPINQLDLSPKYQKLIKRISAVMDHVKTVQDIIHIDVASFSKLPYVGKSYVDLLITLKNALAPTEFSQSNSDVEKVEKILSEIKLSTEQLEMPLNQLTISTQYQRLIKRISTAIGNVNTVQDILNIDPAAFSKLTAVGNKYVNQLIELQKSLPSFLEALAQKLVLFGENYSIQFNDIDNTLIEDVENYLWTLNEMKMDIALSRWGFNQQHETLEEVANRYNVTRERIRQLEKPVNANLPLHLTIQPKILWANIREKMTEDLTALLPNLAKCFATEKLFYAFIELCCQVESGSVRKIIFTEINSKIIDSLFCINQSPIAQEIIINELMSNYGYSRASAINGIKQLEKLDEIEVSEQGVSPKGLSRAEAVAHALTFHPAGLPWKDIARVVNKKGYSSTQMDETRSTHGFNNSEYIYLCGKGTFRNLMYLDLEQFDIPEIMQHLLDYLKQRQMKALHLHDYYYQSKGSRSEIEYFTLRHLVREYGEEYGLYFNGKSSADNVSLDPDLKRLTQADVIIKVLNESKTALTKQEIAERLRSKSINHATFYITNLMEDNKIVRVDQLVYTTPEKAFKDLDTKAIMQVIKDIMKISDIIVEADVFREYVNMELNLSYSKYIYAALVKTQIKELDWYRNGNLFSKKTIPYNSLIDMCKKLCNPELSNSLNVKIIQKAVWLTDAVAMVAINQWKRQKE
ncbi:MAG: hypothetical protein K2Q14_02015 [Gammaproteobacteria bacterium]|nr:hypothetical protein [Gammaproteobacteria bacterium]